MSILYREKAIYKLQHNIVFHAIYQPEKIMFDHISEHQGESKGEKMLWVIK